MVSGTLAGCCDSTSFASLISTYYTPLPATCTTTTTMPPFSPPLRSLIHKVSGLGFNSTPIAAKLAFDVAAAVTVAIAHLSQSCLTQLGLRF